MCAHNDSFVAVFLNGLLYAEPAVIADMIS